MLLKCLIRTSSRLAETISCYIILILYSLRKNVKLVWLWQCSRGSEIINSECELSHQIATCNLMTPLSPALYAYLGGEENAVCFLSRWASVTLIPHCPVLTCPQFVSLPRAVTLYNCSQGREDCSLCRNADPSKSCEWCAAKQACVYEKLCQTDERLPCPNPKISEVS